MRKNGKNDDDIKMNNKIKLYKIYKCTCRYQKKIVRINDNLMLRS